MMKKNSALMNILFYLVLALLVLKSFSNLFSNIGNLTNFKIVVYILLMSVYILLGFVYYRKYIKKDKKNWFYIKNIG